VVLVAEGWIRGTVVPLLVILEDCAASVWPLGLPACILFDETSRWGARGRPASWGEKGTRFCTGQAGSRLGLRRDGNSIVRMEHRQVLRDVR